jgi:hypothetical protein
MSTDRRSDPVGYAEIERHKLDVAIEQFLSRQITGDVFMACLFARGFRASRLRDEFSYWDQVRHQQSGRRINDACGG